MNIEGPPPISPPWNKPYSKWTRIQLDAGLIACLEPQWHNLERHIRDEIISRENRDRMAARLKENR